jgi:hypothetical protein
MKIVVCHCQHCKHGRQYGPHDASVRQKGKSKRAKVRAMLRVGEYEKLPVKVAVGYTD